MDIYEREVKNLLEEGGNERLKSQFMNLSRRLDEVSIENKELKKQISELESELSVKEDLLKIKNRLCGEEPLPFADEQYEEVFLEELRSRDLNFNLVSKMLDVIELMLTDAQS